MLHGTLLMKKWNILINDKTMKNLTLIILFHISIMQIQAQNALSVELKNDSTLSNLYIALDTYIDYLEKETYPADNYYIYCDMNDYDSDRIQFFYSSADYMLTGMLQDSFIGSFVYKDYRCLFGLSMLKFKPCVVISGIVPILHSKLFIAAHSSCTISVNNGNPHIMYYMYSDIQNDIDYSFYFNGDTCYYYNPSGYPYDKQKGVVYIKKEQ